MYLISRHIKSTLIVYSLLTVSYICVGWIHSYYCVPNTSLDIIKSMLFMGSPVCNTAIDIIKIIHELSAKWWATIGIIIISGLTSQQQNLQPTTKQE